VKSVCASGEEDGDLSFMNRLTESSNDISERMVRSK
jgi:hypothetical protein